MRLFELPIELWAEIFECAVDDRELQDPLFNARRHRPRPSSPPPSNHGTRGSSISFQMQQSSALGESSNSGSAFQSGNSSCERRLDATLTTKLAIVSTCTQWRRIGLPYLFRTVQFTSLRRLQLFTGLVRGSRYRYVPGPHNIQLLLEGRGTGYGALIRRIETEIDLNKDPSDHVIYVDILSDLLKCCPYLRIYVNRNSQAGVPTPSTIIDGLSKANSPELTFGLRSGGAGGILDSKTLEAVGCGIERLEWSGKEGLVVGDLTYLLRSTPNVRKLVLGPVFLCSTRLSDTLSDPAIPLLYLESMHIDLTSVHRAYIRYTRRWVMPSLAHLQVLVGPAPWQSDLLFLLDAVGAGLRALHLRVNQHTSMLTADWSKILSRCPNVTSLVFDVAAMPLLPHSESLPLPSLRVVGLEGCLPDFRATNEYDRPESDRREQLMEHLNSLILRSGTIRFIRMMDDEFIWISGKNAENSGTMGWEIPRRRKLTREFNTWKECKMTLRLAGITLTDYGGQPIG